MGKIKKCCLILAYRVAKNKDKPTFAVFGVPVTF